MLKQMLSVEITPDLLQLQLMKYYLKKWQPDFVSINSLSRFSFDNITQCAKFIQKEIKIPVVLHITGLGRNQNDIDELLKVIHKNGINKLLLLRGNKYNNLNLKSDFPYASDLVKYVKNSNYQFDVIGACYPEIHPEAKSLVDDIKHLKKKVNAGCNQLMSQMFFDNHRYYKFINEIKKQNIKLPILAGVMPVTEMQTVNWLKKANMTLPSFVHQINNLPKNGIDFAIAQINDLYNHQVNGVHLYTMNNWNAIDQIIKNIKRSELNV